MAKIDWQARDFYTQRNILSKRIDRLLKADEANVASKPAERVKSWLQDHTMRDFRAMSPQERYTAMDSINKMLNDRLLSMKSNKEYVSNVKKELTERGYKFDDKNWQSAYDQMQKDKESTSAAKGRQWYHYSKSAKSNQQLEEHNEELRIAGGNYDPELDSKAREALADYLQDNNSDRESLYSRLRNI